MTDAKRDTIIHKNDNNNSRYCFARFTDIAHQFSDPDEKVSMLDNVIRSNLKLASRACPSRFDK